MEKLTESEIRKRMEELRVEMVRFVLKYGFQHPDVYEYSRQIDQLHNLLNRLKKNATGSLKSRKDDDYLYETRLAYVV